MGSHKVFKWHSKWIKLGKVMDLKIMDFPVMYGCDSWTIKKAEHWRINAFKLWCLRRLLRVPWTARRSKQSILKEINPEYSLEGLTLKLKLQYFGYLMRRASSLEKTLMLGKIEGRKRRGWQRSVPFSVTRQGWSKPKGEAVSWVLQQHSSYVETCMRNLSLKCL